MTTTKKYQVFVSSTYEDLKTERDQVIKAVLEIGHIPVGMEMFSAADEEQWQIIKNQIDDIDYYVLIVGHKYGSVTPEGLSYTEKEFDYAASKGIPVLGFILDGGAKWPANLIETDPGKKKSLENFKEKITKRLVQFWKNTDDLHAKVSIALSKAITANPRTGWVKADAITGPEVTRELTRLSAENAVLRQKYEALQKKAEAADDKLLHIVKVLRKNVAKFQVRFSGKWDEAEFHEATLMDIFESCAPNLISENSTLGIAQNIALGISKKTGYWKNYPIGSNVVAGFIADFAALDLIEASKLKHSVKDGASYWTLTAMGRNVLKESRRLLLEAGIAPPAPPNAGTTPAESDQP